MLFFYGVLRYAGGVELASRVSAWTLLVCQVNCGIALVQTGFRVYAAASIYGWPFALLAPIRALWGNLVNFGATATALWDFFDSRRRGTGLAWRKTDHLYPEQSVG